MSLEQALKENTEAMASLVKANKELNDVINSLIAVMRNAPSATHEADYAEWKSEFEKWKKEAPATRAEPKEQCQDESAVKAAIERKTREHQNAVKDATPIDPSLPPLVEAIRADHAASKVEQEAKKSDSTSSGGTPPDTAAVSYDDLKKAFLDLSNAKGREVCVTLLSKFGCTKLPQILEFNYAEMFADIKKAMA